MSRFYVPWRSREPKSLGAFSSGVAAAARSAAGFFTPIIVRFPGALFLIALVGACLGVWGVSLLMRSVVEVERALVDAGLATAGSALSLEQARSGLEKLDSRMPAGLLWVLQSSLLRDLVALGGALGFVSVLAMFAIWWERKVSAFMQSRLGPMRVGGWHGWSQSLADGIKLIAKEDLIPAGADGPLFRLAPYLSFVPVLLAFVALPFGLAWVYRDLDVALLFVLSMLGIDVLGVLIAGWAANNKWSVYGALREACQLVAYEIPMGMALLIPVMVAGSLRLSEIAAHQAGGWQNWLAFHSPWTFAAALGYFIASLAACKRAPFDLPEAESELVAGFHVEYSGIRWALFFFAEYASMFVVSALCVLLFLGAWDAPWAGLAPAGAAESRNPATQLLYGVLCGGPLWFVGKSLLLVYLQMWLRWTLPRLRIDQVLYSCVQVLLPLMMAVLLASTFWELAIQQSATMRMVAGGISVLLAIVGALIAIAIVAVAFGGRRVARALVGEMYVQRPLRGG